MSTMNKGNQCFYSDDGRVWRSNKDGSLSPVTPREATRRDEASSRKSRAARHHVTTTTGEANTVPSHQPRYPEADVNSRKRVARDVTVTTKTTGADTPSQLPRRYPGAEDSEVQSISTTSGQAAAVPDQRPRYPGAVPVGTTSMLGDDDATIQIGGESVAAVAHMVDTEEEMRLHQEYERTARERDAYRQLFERATVAEVVLAPEMSAMEQGTTTFCEEQKTDDEVVIPSTRRERHERGGTPQETQQSSDCAPPRQCNKKWLAIIGGTVLVLLVAIVIGVVFGVQNSSKTDRLVFVPLDLIDLLSSVSSDGGEALRTHCTPQKEALEWLAGNENLTRYSDEQKIQRYALATCYFSMGGDDWEYKHEWLDDCDECDRWWNGGDLPPTLRCTESGALVELDLSDNNLYGEIPPEIGLLSNSLELLRLGDGSNALFGTLVTEIGQLTKLVNLRLSRNDLTGPLPTEMFHLTNLGRLLLNTNYFSGSIPSELGMLTKLSWLDLCCNRFTGTIPSTIQNMKNLEGIHLYDNKFNDSFVCPDVIESCWISCGPQPGFGDECRSFP